LTSTSGSSIVSTSFCNVRASSYLGLTKRGATCFDAPSLTINRCCGNS
jgi:hypothetical protein